MRSTSTITSAVSVPRPGGFYKLEQLVGRLHSPLMDRSRPLWELYIIEGLASGQVALYDKMHHAGIDGQAGVALAKVLFADAPNPPPPKPPHAVRRPALPAGRGRAGRRGAARRRYKQANILKSLPKTAKSMLDMLAPVSDDSGKRHLGKLGKLQRAPATPLNVSISNQRAFAARSVPLAEIKAMSDPGQPRGQNEPRRARRMPGPTTRGQPCSKACDRSGCSRCSAPHWRCSTFRCWRCGTVS